MSTNRERILRTIVATPGLTDGEIRAVTGVEPHQQVNQICRSLEREGLVRRTGGIHGKIVNLPTAVGERPQVLDGQQTGGSSSDVAAKSSTRHQPARVHSTEHDKPPLDWPEPATTMVIIPCSGRKLRALGGSAAGPSVAERLPEQLSSDLLDARRRVAPLAHVDEYEKMPAVQRYVGGFYEMSSSAIRSARSPIAILSGGYGLLLPLEPIGWYDRAFSLADWPKGLLQRCLVAFAQEARVEQVVAFCARSTSYASLVRSTPWSREGIAARLVYPVVGAGNGAQAIVPRALGRAVTRYLARVDVGQDDGAHKMAVEEL